MFEFNNILYLFRRILDVLMRSIKNKSSVICNQNQMLIKRVFV